MRYRRVTDEQTLLDGLAEPGGVILCGGTDLLVKMRRGLTCPELLLDVSELETLRGIRRSGPAIEIGAATPESEILASPLVRSSLPLLAAALRKLGSVQIRNRGTLGGNLVNASPAADSAIPLLLYEGNLVLVGPKGERIVAVEAFFVGPGKTVLEPGEFVRTIRIPVPDNEFTTFYHKVGKRQALTIAIASVGALIRTDGARFAEVRFAAGSVAPTPVRLRAVEKRLAQATVGEDVLEEARRLAAGSVSPITDIRASANYRQQVIGDLVVRALWQAFPA